MDRLSRGLRDPTFLLGHLAQRLDDLSTRLRQALAGQVLRRRDRVDALAGHLRAFNPAVQVERGRERVMMLSARLTQGMRRHLDRLHEEAAVLGARLQTLSPLQTLARGYVVARTLPGHRVVRTAIDVAPGDRLELILHRGRALCRVEASEDHPGG
jgi:exodeoxyribonuclease VII large subunit